MADDDLEPLITECPSCNTRFRVAESHLQHAGGRVRCGACLTVFNGIEHLTLESARQFASEEQAQQELDALLDELAGDQPQNESGKARHATVPAGPPSGKPHRQASRLSPPPANSPRLGPIFAGYEVDEPQPPVPLAQRLGVRQPPGKQTSAPETATPPIGKSVTYSRVDHAPAGKLTAPRAAVPEPTDNFSFHVLNEGAAPAPPATTRNAPAKNAPADEALARKDSQKEPAAKATTPPAPPESAQPSPAGGPVFGDPRPWRPWVWAGIALGTLLLAAQVLWYQFDSWGKDPLWRSVYAPMCRVLGCELPVQRDTALLRTRNLAVRSHPDVSNSLQVDAVIVNDAEFAQPFPVLELRFTTVRGMLVAGRRFEPSEYLAGDAQGMRLMPPRTPVQIALTIDDPGPAAVNYFLRFR